MNRILENLSIKLKIGSVTFTVFLENSFWDLDIGLDVERHNHSTYEVHLITDGRGILQVENDKMPLSPGTLYITKPGIFHFHKQDSGNPIKKYCFKFEFRFNKNEENIINCSEIEPISNVLSNNFVIVHDLSKLESEIHTIHSEILNNDAFYYARIQQLFGQIFITVFRKMADEYNTLIKSSTEMISEERISIIENFFDHCPDFNAKPHELCQKLFISPSQLNRILKKLYNKSFKQKMTEIRFEYAKHLLENSDISIKKIAEKTAYNSEGNFSIAFKKITSMSPSIYRNLYSNNQ